MMFQPTFAFVAPVGPADNKLLEGEEFMNARVKEIATISVDWTAMAAVTGGVQPVNVARFILATNDVFPALFPDPPTVAAYRFVPSATQIQWFHNTSSNFNRWVLNSDNVTLVQKKKWRMSPPGAPVSIGTGEPGRSTTLTVKAGKFFKGKKTFEDTSGQTGIDAKIILKGWNFYTVWLWYFDEQATISEDNTFLTVTVDNYTYFKDP